MDQNNRSILHRNLELLVSNLVIDEKFCIRLVRSGMVTVSMVDEIKVC